MKRKGFCLILSCLMVLSMVLVSCGTKTTPITTATPTSTTPPTATTTTPTTIPTTTTGKWWDKFGEPQYGGTMTLRRDADYKQFDPYKGSYPPYEVYEQLGTYDWTLDRKIWNFQARFSPVEYRTGLLTESWERPDLATMVFHIRKGVHWQDKPPVNGRELTASDIAYTYNREYGKGDGFTKPSPLAPTQFALLESVTATDKYTVVFKWKQPSIEMVDSILDFIYSNFIVAREVVEKYGSLDNWNNAVGTGPFILIDYVSGSSVTFDRNPNYWGFDERFPKNSLPYIDTLKELIIPDIATTLAGLRTGKIDLLVNTTWNQAANLKKTNPELLQIAADYYGVSIDYRCDTVPFKDIRVRTALQMSIDLKTIAATYYGGTVDGTPYGLVSPALVGYYTPYDKWPQNVKDEYAYNPAGAKKLLADAGYPKGFKTNVVAVATADLDLLQVIKSYFSDVGVDMEIRVLELTAWTAFINAGKQDQMVSAVGTGSGTASIYPPSRLLTRRYSTHMTNYTYNNDPIYDQFYDKFAASLDVEEQRLLTIQANDRIISQHWSLHVLPTVTYNIYQPWFNGYSGEELNYNSGFYVARFWIDQNMKKAMGH
jgi:peptide/nickel transport system substrate-binding protein